MISVERDDLLRELAKMEQTKEYMTSDLAYERYKEITERLKELRA